MVRIPEGQGFFSCPNSPDQSRVSPNYLCNGNRKVFPTGKMSGSRNPPLKNVGIKIRDGILLLTRVYLIASRGMTVPLFCHCVPAHSPNALFD